MATKDHVTTFKGASPLQDPVPVNQAGVQESVSDTADVTRASQLNENVAKTQALAVLTGDSVNAPVGSIADILDRDHANGDARQVRLRDRAGDPTNAANKGFAYSKGGEAYWIDSSGNVTQLTEGGVVRSTALRETGGPTVLPVGAWADGEYLKRSGATAVGDTPAGGGVAAPGVRIEISDGQPVNDITLGATDTKILPEDESSISFDVPVSGLYRVDFSLQVVCPSSNTTGQFKVVFDEAGTPQTVGYTDQWQARQTSSGDYLFLSLIGQVELTAGTHTVTAYAKEVTGTGMEVAGSSTIAAGTPVLELLLVSGSGAGGILAPQKYEQTANRTVTALTLSPVPTEPMTLDFTTHENEVVTLGFHVQAKGGTGANTAYLQLRLDGTLVGIQLESILAQTTWGEYLSDTFNVQVTAGVHTLELYAATFTGQDWNIQAGSWISVDQYRGGLVPWERDGVEVSATPRAINIVGGVVDVADDGTGKLEVSLPTAVTAPGYFSEHIINGADISASSLIVDNGNPGPHKLLEHDFEIPATGSYRVAIAIGGYARYEGDGSCKFYVVFDEGLGSEVSYPSDDRWSQPVADSAFANPTYEGNFQLPAGTRQCRVYVENIAGPSNFEIGGGTADWEKATYVGVSVHHVSGSGAGGVLVDEQLMTGGDFDPGASWADVPGCSHTLQTVAEPVLMLFLGDAVAGTVGTLDIRWNIDSDTTIVPATGDGISSSGGSTYSSNFSNGVFSPTLTPGSHVIKLQAKRNNAYVIKDGAKTQVTRFRGGFDPREAEGLVISSDTLTSNQSGLTATRPPTTVVPGLSVAVQCVVGEHLRLNFDGFAQDNVGNDTIGLTFAVDGTPVLTEPVAETVGTNGHAVNVSFGHWFTATATSHTVTLLYGVDPGGSYTIWKDATLSVAQYRGGLAVETVTVDTANRTLDGEDSPETVTNEGATGQVDVTLPPAAAGLRYTVVVLAAQTLRLITDSTADDIRIAGSITAGASRYAEASTVGHTLTVLGVSGGLWLATAVNGAWTLST